MGPLGRKAGVWSGARCLFSAGASPGAWERRAIGSGWVCSRHSAMGQWGWRSSEQGRAALPGRLAGASALFTFHLP